MSRRKSSKKKISKDLLKKPKMKGSPKKLSVNDLKRYV